ncbi:MAG: 1-(5-phosphoribosyl)-5-[(5-phosphoribosylamino)methylideneamino]imidazole-4-carboxamide isomerase [Christensenellales bacterium]|jgi:phosphoribosylformimino-5-aminoimidazole carboxamide ribotide isomerase
MKIFPAIDILNGKVVRLTKGAFDKVETYADEPYEVAKSFLEAGAKCLHIVDLDGAKSGIVTNFDKIKKVASLGFEEIQVGGGIRSMDKIETYLSCGVTRLIIGTTAVTNFTFVEEAVVKYGDKIAVGVDARKGYVATHGWQETSNISAMDFCKKCQNAGVKTIIYTDIDTDGAMEGTNLKVFKTLKEKLDLNIIASGGVSSYDDISALSAMNVYGAIIGKALYLGAINLKKALSLVNR